VTVYVDTSVLLRVVLAEPGRLRSWKAITRPVASELVRLESLRTIDRARIQLALDDQEVAHCRQAIFEHIDAFELISLDSAVLERAAEPFPTVVGTLDALHLASALLARAEVPDLRFATHDRELTMAARAMGFDILR
jgi:predicted nucleic acid-binding protein